MAYFQNSTFGRYTLCDYMFSRRINISISVENLNIDMKFNMDMDMTWTAS
jgi:hypothetical protein